MQVVKTLFFSILFLGLCRPSVAAAQDADQAEIDLSNPQRTKYPIAMPMAVGGDKQASKEILEIATDNFNMSGWAKMLNPSGFLANIQSEGLAIVPEDWKNVGAYGVIKYFVSVTGNRFRVEFRLFEVEKGAKPVLEKTFSGDLPNLRRYVHQWCNEVVRHYTGDAGFFGSRLVFSEKKRVLGGRSWSSVATVGFDGRDLRRLTKIRTLNILPRWSPDGTNIVFTSYRKKNPDLYVLPTSGGTPRVLSARRGMNLTANYSPDGRKIVASLSKDGNPEIYILDAFDGSIIRRITKSRYIDTSPAWSPDGSEIVFVSNRQGGPQIFVVSSNGGTPRRVSFNGSYNTDPVWSPKSGKRLVAYTTRSETGKMDVVTLDLKTDKMVRVTQNEGNHEEPSFAPNGHAIAYTKTGRDAGIYIANVDGTGDARRVYKGRASSVNWGPAPRP